MLDSNATNTPKSDACSVQVTMADLRSLTPPSHARNDADVVLAVIGSSAASEELPMGPIAERMGVARRRRRA